MTASSRVSHGPSGTRPHIRAIRSSSAFLTGSVSFSASRAACFDRFFGIGGKALQAEDHGFQEIALFTV